MSTNNTALAEEQEALNSIYDPETLAISNSDAAGLTSAVLTLPDLPFSFHLTFPSTYPDVPPSIDGIQSTGASTKKGEGEAAARTLRQRLGKIYIVGQVCLFDLIEDVLPLLSSDDSAETPSYIFEYGAVEDNTEVVENRSAFHDTPHIHPDDLTQSSTFEAAAASSIPPPKWIISEPLVVSKSTFVARSLAINNLPEAKESITHLLSTNKKVASATHNITAWRIRQAPRKAQSKLDTETQNPDSEIIIQDCDDDGETAAGGRLLHLMQLMDVWNCVVVVTRWYGGVKLGPDRFRCINAVARESLVKGGFVKEEKEGHGGNAKGGKKKKK